MKLWEAEEDVIKGQIRRFAATAFSVLGTFLALVGLPHPHALHIQKQGSAVVLGGKEPCREHIAQVVAVGSGGHDQLSCSLCRALFRLRDPPGLGSRWGDIHLAMKRGTFLSD